MSRPRLVILLLIAALLGGSVLLFRTRPGPEGAVPLLDVPAVSIVSMRVEPPVGSQILIERAAPASAWAMTWTGQDGLERRWPVSESRVRAALRIVTGLHGEPIRDARPDPDGTRVTLTSAEGVPVNIRLDRQTLAARGRVRVEAPSHRLIDAMVSDEVHRIFERDNLIRWRDDRALPGFDGSASRFTAESPDERLRLGVVRGRWGLQSPFVERAEPRIVRELMDALNALAVVRFRDDMSPEAVLASADRPVLVLTTETDIYSPSADDRERRVVIRRLTVVGPADAGGERLLAIAEASSLTPHSGAIEPATDKMVVEIATDALNALPLNPVVLVSRRAIAMPALDVGRFELLSGQADDARSAASIAERTLDGWIVLDDARPRQVSAEHAAGIETVLALLADIDADLVRHTPAGPPAGFEWLADLTLRGLDGGEIARCTIGVAPMPATNAAPEAAAVVRIGEITRYYRATRSHVAIAWLASADGG